MTLHNKDTCTIWSEGIFKHISLTQVDSKVNNIFKHIAFTQVNSKANNEKIKQIVDSIFTQIIASKGIKSLVKE